MEHPIIRGLFLIGLPLVIGVVGASVAVFPADYQRWIASAPDKGPTMPSFNSTRSSTAARSSYIFTPP